MAGPADKVHVLIEHLVRNEADRVLVRENPDSLFERFGIDELARSVLREGSRDELSQLGVHGNYVIKWLIWSGRPTLPFFSMNHYFDRR